MDELKAASEKVGFDVSQVLTWAIRDDALHVVVDNGIKGCPKYIIPLSELVEAEKPIEIEAQPEEAKTITRKRRTK